MRFQDLKYLMISISDFKKQISEIVANKITKVIVKNNEPVSVIMPYDKYTDLVNQHEGNQKALWDTGHPITFPNGVQVLVSVETDNEDDSSFKIKIYKRMRTSEELELHYTLTTPIPSVETTLTTEEIMEYWKQQSNKQK